MLSGFKQFVLRGNVVDLAVGVVIGAAFGTVVTASGQGPYQSADRARGGQARFYGDLFQDRYHSISDWRFHHCGGSFVLVAAAVYFFVVTPINVLIARSRKDPAPADPTTKKCPECLSEIPIDAHRCSFCAQPVMGKAA